VIRMIKGLSQNRRGLAHFAQSSEQNVPVPLSAAKRIVLVALCVAGIVSSARAQETLYAATGSKGANGVLYTVNPATAAFTAVGPILAGVTPVGVTGLSFDPLNGILYGVTGLESPNFPRNLITINSATGAATIIGPLVDPVFGSEPLSDISFRAEGTLFGFSPDDLFTVNLATGGLTRIGPTGMGTPGGGLAFNPAGTLYATSGLVASGTLDTLNPSTAARTPGPAITNAPHAGSLGAINALAFNSAGILYGSNSDRAQNGATVTNVDLIKIITATGVVTNIGALPGNTDAIAFSLLIPEPSSFYLLGVGAAMSACILLRARTR
jgi:hypothetical protein